MIPIIDLLYPRRCPVCQDIVKQNAVNPLICPECFKKLPYVQEPRCMKCGKALEREEREYCGDCTRIPKHFQKGFPLFEYTDPVKAGVAAFKYNNRREYAQFYGEELWKSFGETFAMLHPDGIVPVPVHSNKRKKRGYNQAELLAQQLSKRLEIPCYPKLLVRCLDTLPQKELNDRERLNNLKKAFIFKENDVKLKTVLLVDDIYTSGATIEACTEAMFQGGVEKVYFTSICIGRGFDACK